MISLVLTDSIVRASFHPAFCFTVEKDSCLTQVLEVVALWWRDPFAPECLCGPYVAKDSRLERLEPDVWTSPVSDAAPRREDPRTAQNYEVSQLDSVKNKAARPHLSIIYS